MSEHYDQEFYNSQRTNSSQSAIETVPIIVDLIKPASVLDVGCGIGTWSSVFQNNGVEAYGVDGDYVDRKMLLISRAQFSSCDLSAKIEIPEQWPQKFDIAMSLEVAEHLPESSADMFVRSLVSFSDIVLFAAAIPFQGGTNHINEQWQTYWSRKFGDLGYVPVDVVRPSIWGNPNVAYVYSENTILYIKKEKLSEFPQLQTYVRDPDSAMLAVVHPQKWEKTANPDKQSPKKLAASLFRAIKSKLLR